MPRALIITTANREIYSSVERAFRALRWDCQLFAVPPMRWRSIYSLFGIFGKKHYRSKEEERKFNRLLKEINLSSGPGNIIDLVLFIKPLGLDQENFKRLSNLNIPIITWATDSLARYPGQASTIPISKATYLIDGGEAELAGAVWLPLGFDDTIFAPGQQEKYDYDVLFIGNISGSSYIKRRAYLKKLRSSPLCRKYRIGFIGASGSRIENYLSWMPGRINWVAKHLPIEELAKHIAKSRICINIHQDDGQEPVNPMVFAISGCRVCQILEDREYFSRWLEPGLEYAAINQEDLIGTLEALLSDDKRIRDIANAGYQASQKHAYLVRMKQVLREANFVL